MRLPKWRAIALFAVAAVLIHSAAVWSSGDRYQISARMGGSTYRVDTRTGEVCRMRPVMVAGERPAEGYSREDYQPFECPSGGNR